MRKIQTLSDRESAVRVLTSARNLIACPQTWSPTGKAFDREGKPCLVKEPEAVRFSAYGAVDKAGPTSGSKDVAWKALDDTLHDWLRRLGVEEIDTEITRMNLFNAESSHSMVVAFFDETIARLQRASD